MRSKLFAPLFLFIIALTTTANAETRSNKAESLARQAISENTTESKAAIATLRSMGTEGLNALFTVYASDIKRYIETGEQTAEWTKIAGALDAVAMQKDAYAARLYWHTDFDKAKEESLKSKKPILSLRLLGNLNEEFSCANSRFFRTVLYANEDISSILRERFVLHWKSVRPAPHVTIDFGDGRKIESTITGNSIHYILDSNGLPIDALVGLNGPATFKRWLIQTEDAFKKLEIIGNKENGSDNANNAKQDALVNYHLAQIEAIKFDWANDLKKTGVMLPKEVIELTNANRPPTAMRASPLAITKRAVEFRVLKQITVEDSLLEAKTDIESWRKIAELHLDDAKLDQNSIGLIRRKTFTEEKNPNKQLIQLIKNFEGYIALDTVRNAYLLQKKLHVWLRTDLRNDLDKLNEKVYAELFLTPSSDPWLGLYSPDTYTAISGGGIIK